MIDSVRIYEGIQAREAWAETELVSFLKANFQFDYLRTLGPLAEDYLQELAIEVIQAIRENRLREPETLIGFCQSLALRIRINGLRSGIRAARRLVPIDQAAERALDRLKSAEDVENELIQFERRTARFSTVLRLMERLDPISREVVRRYYLEEQKAAQIEEEMGLAHDIFQRVKDDAVKKMRRDHRTLAQGWSIPGGRKPPGRFKAALPLAA